MTERRMKKREGTLKDYSSTNQSVTGRTAVARELGTIPPIDIMFRFES